MRSLVMMLPLMTPLLLGSTDCCGFDEEDYDECLQEDRGGDVCGEDGRTYASLCDAEWYDVDVASDGRCRDGDDPISADRDGAANQVDGVEPDGSVPDGSDTDPTDPRTADESPRDESTRDDGAADAGDADDGDADDDLDERVDEAVARALEDYECVGPR